ncbi:MAG: spiro-SPASM protein [Turneriella sp.]
MSGSHLLIHIRAEDASALEVARMADDASVQQLLDRFVAQLQGYESVSLCCDHVALRDDLSRRLPSCSVLEVQSEISAVRRLFSDKAVSHIAIANGVYPLLDKVVNEKLFHIHHEYRADISYAENVPAGIALNFVSRDLLESLDIMEAKDEHVSSGIRAFVEKNINQFHAEVHYEEPDLRLFRLDFSMTSARSIAKTKRFLDKAGNTENPYAQLKSIIDASPEILHVFPSYLELEFNATTEAVSYFSPLAHIKQEPALLSRENFLQVKNFIAQGLGDTSICASGIGEPLEHPDAPEYLQELLACADTRLVFIETNGIHLDKILPLAAHAQAAKLRIIVLLNSLTKFAEYSGAPQATLEKIKVNFRNFAQALAQAGKNPQEQLFLQAFKVEENEAEIDALYALAEELGGSFLFQKYNRYAGLMPERRVSDMTPLERYSCWHLRRDLFIRANGDVAFCKQTVDPAKPSARGNLAKDSLSALWAAQGQDFVLNYREKYPGHLPCAQCDEYFTFNY